MIVTVIILTALAAVLLFGAIGAAIGEIKARIEIRKLREERARLKY